MPQSRAADGTFAESVSDEDLLFFLQTGDRPYQSTREVVDEFGLSDSQVRRRLESLAEEGKLKEVELSERNRVWQVDRDVVVLRPEDDGYSAHDTTTGVASGGETRAAALRSLAEAVELAESDERTDPDLEDIEIDTTDGDGSLPFDDN